MFNIEPHKLDLLVAVRDAVLAYGKVAVLHRKHHSRVPEVIVGVARHVVMPDSIGFAFEWTPECRLRVTGTFEHFIPLADIVAVVPQEDA
jgi:hypothetical protein